MRIGFDIDGVLYPWTAAVNDAVIERFDIPDPGEHQYWDYLKERLTGEQWQWVWSDEAAPAVFGRYLHMEDGCTACDTLLLCEYDVHFITHRDPRKTASITARWLGERFRRYAGLHVLGNGINKSDLVRGLGLAVMIDDKPEVCDDVLRNSNAEVFMPTRPWNSRYEPQPYLENRFHRFENWQEVIEWLA